MEMAVGDLNALLQVLQCSRINYRRPIRGVEKRGRNAVLRKQQWCQSTSYVVLTGGRSEVNQI